MNKLLSPAPYFFRAHYDWLLDNQLTPHLLLNPSQAAVRLPTHLRRGQALVLNLAPRAIQNLQVDQKAIAFSARFQGVPFAVFVPWPAAVALYGQERPQESELFFQTFQNIDNDFDNVHEDGIPMPPKNFLKEGIADSPKDFAEDSRRDSSPDSPKDHSGEWPADSHQDAAEEPPPKGSHLRRIK